MLLTFVFNPTHASSVNLDLIFSIFLLGIRLG